MLLTTLTVFVDVLKDIISVNLLNEVKASTGTNAFPNMTESVMSSSPLVNLRSAISKQPAGNMTNKNSNCNLHNLAYNKLECYVIL